MTFGLFGVRRARARLGLLSLITVTVGFIAAILSGILGFTQLASTDALRGLAVSTFTEDSFFRVHTTVSGDPAAQQDAADGAFAALSLTDGLAINNTTYADPLGLSPSGPATGLAPEATILPFAWDPQAGTTTTAGTLEAFGSGTGSSGTDSSGTSGSGTSGSPVPAAITGSTAGSLDLKVGDTFAVGSASGSTLVEIAAVVVPKGPNAAYFVPVPAQGTDVVEPVVIAVPAATLEAFSGAPKTQWVFTLDPRSVSAAGLPAPP